MKILLVNTNATTGGAAIATLRLANSLRENGIDARMLVANRDGGDPRVVETLPNGWRHKWHFLWERLRIFAMLRFRRQRLFDIDPAWVGTDITRLQCFREADVIHLNWVNQGFLSLKDLERIMQSGKPVVWTMHDMWNFMGICHYERECGRYKQGCGWCPLLVERGENDLSRRRWEVKRRLYEGRRDIVFVGCSQWIAQAAKESPLLAGHRVESIVNPIDCQVYRPLGRGEVRRRLGLPQDKTLLLFCAFNVTSPLKGLSYLREALQIMSHQNPGLTARLGLVLIGKESETEAQNFAVETYPMGLVNDVEKKVEVYNAANLFVIPSTQDNLPNTLVEAKACGLPVVGSRVGGIPQMIHEQKDGMLVNPADSQALAETLTHLLTSADLDAMGRNSRQSALEEYSTSAVAERYIRIYKEVYETGTSSR